MFSYEINDKDAGQISEDNYWIDHRGLVLNSYKKTCTELIAEDLYWIHIIRHVLICLRDVYWNDPRRHVLKQTCTGLSSEDAYWIIRRHVLNVFRVLDWALKMCTELSEDMYWMYFGYWIELWRCVLKWSQKTLTSNGSPHWLIPEDMYWIDIVIVIVNVTVICIIILLPRL